MKVLTACLFGASALVMSGCNTMEGAGKDVSRGGEKVQNAAHRASNALRNSFERADVAYREGRARCASLPAADQRAACRDQARQEYYARRTEARTTYRTEDERLEQQYRLDYDKCYNAGDNEQCYAETRTRYYIWY